MASDTPPRHAPVKPYLRDRVRAQAIELLPRRGSFPPNLLPSGGLKATQRAHSPYFSILCNYLTKGALSWFFPPAVALSLVGCLTLGRKKMRERRCYG